MVHGSCGVQAKPAVSTCTRIQVTCDGCSVTGEGCGMTKSHPQCDPCHTLVETKTKAIMGNNF